MAWPKRNSRKGLMLRTQQIALDMFRDWCPYNGQWQADVNLRARTKTRIAALRDALDALEAKL